MLKKTKMAFVPVVNLILMIVLIFKITFSEPSPYPQLPKEEHTMIKITPDFPCIHCGACAKACSHGVIKMVPNEEGKLIPRVSFSSCRYCRACRWACPVIPREEV